MARFRVVEFWPSTGHLDRTWTDEPETDVWVRSARRVCELYSEALRAVDLHGPVGSLRFMTVPRDDGSDSVHAEVRLDHPESWESGAVWVPSAVTRLSPAARGRLVLDAIDAVVTELAPHRGWPLPTIAALREHVLGRQLRFGWASAWKASPDRRLEARASFRLLDDGFGRVHLEIRDRHTKHLLARSVEVLAYSTLAGFKRTAATLKWSDGIVVAAPFIGVLGRLGDELRLDPAQGMLELPPVGRAEAPDDGELSLTFAGTWTVPEEPSIRVVGGGPTNGVPVDYLDELDQSLDVVERDYLTWWSAADRRRLEIWYDFEAGPEQPTTRRTKDKLIARIHRDPRTIRAAQDPRELARGDVHALMEAVRSKMGLGPQPEPDGA